MRNLFGGMYLRPGNLWKTYIAKRLKVSNVNGYKTETYEEIGCKVVGILAEASTNDSERNKHRWNQDQHSLTHTMVVKKKYNLKKGDILFHEEKRYLVLTDDDIGCLGKSGLIYLEERNDIK